MTVAELLKKEKGKYTNYQLHYKTRKNTPFYFINGRKNENMSVIDWYYDKSESLQFDLKFKFKGKRQDNTLIIIWKNKE